MKFDLTSIVNHVQNITFSRFGAIAKMMKFQIFNIDDEGNKLTNWQKFEGIMPLMYSPVKKEQIYVVQGFGNTEN